MPPNANIFQPGPAWVFVVVNGIPSNGTYVTVGSGKIEQQTLSAASSLPASQRREGATGSADGSTTGGNNGSMNLSAGINVASSAVLAFLAFVISL
ncbi:hypothetical protein MPER_06479 [Moniliophthora perniciosa FA553]|nr:hypothetical protein MPER_06479 [Moniliophthora perniciosa FA553]